MNRPTFLSLFSGIGGLDLGLERAGWTCVGQVEIDPYCQRVLAKHWPEVPRWGDIKELNPDDLPRADLIAAGFPCQPVSVAGRGLAQADSRWLWPEAARLVRHLRPRWVLLENVPGLLARGMGDVLGDLAACGYDAEWDCVPASAAGAPHQRDRVWIVAYPGGEQHQGHRPTDERPAAAQLPAAPVADADSHGRDQWTGTCNLGRGLAEPANGHSLADPDGAGLEGQRLQRTAPECRDGMANTPGERWCRGIFTRPNLVNDRPEPPHRHAGIGGDGGWWAAEPDVGRVAHGIPNRVDRLRALGNAVVPQVAEHIGRLILKAELAPTGT